MIPMLGKDALMTCLNSGLTTPPSTDMPHSCLVDKTNRIYKLIFNRDSVRSTIAVLHITLRGGDDDDDR